MVRVFVCVLLINSVLWAGLPPNANNVARESVDLMELNHFYDEHGRHVFDQVIFYDWSSEEARYNVRAWRLVKQSSQVPVMDWNVGKYVAFWTDGEQLRKVCSPSIRETWTQFDPELAEREYLAKEKRIELKTIKVNYKIRPVKTENLEQEMYGKLTK